MSLPLLFGACQCTEKGYEASPQSIRAVADAIVEVVVYDETGRHIGNGSAVYINNSLFLTANHVVDTENAAFFLKRNNQPELYSTEVIYESDYDLAILRCPTLHVPYVQISGTAAKLADTVFSFGYFNTELTFNKGVVRSTKGDVFQASTSIWYGASGGAILNENLELVGIITAMWSPDGNMVLAEYTTVISIDVIKEKIDEYSSA